MGKRNIDKTCFSKDVFETEEDVLEYAEYLEQKYGKRMYCYKCPICGKYHLTSKFRKGCF